MPSDQLVIRSNSRGEELDLSGVGALSLDQLSIWSNGVEKYKERMRAKLC